MSALLLGLALSLTDPLAPLAEPATVTRPATRPERMIRRGEPVTLRVRSGTLTIATAGRALGDGRLGERVRVVATATRRTLEGIVEGPGEVRLVTP